MTPTADSLASRSPDGSAHSASSSPADGAAGNPGSPVGPAVEYVLKIASTWYAWDGQPVATEDNVWTPHKALRRVQDHLLDHLAEVEALLAGAPTIPDTWYGRTVTIDADWARFTEADLAEARSRLSRLAQLYELRFAAAGPAEWDRPRTPAWTLREIAKHVAEVTWYADQIGALPRSA
ncbi:MAG TPA: hypothetical protein VGK55_14390 [Actinomycetes bacterium]|jgi:hypothetical protein